MRKKLKDIGYAGLGLGVVAKEKVQSLITKGKKSGKRLPSTKELEDTLKKSAVFAGKEALVISKKSLEMLERELKKLEREARKTKAPAKKARRKKR